MKSKKCFLFLFLIGFFQIYAKIIYITVPENFLTDPDAERDERSKHLYVLRKSLLKLGYEVKSLILPQPLKEDEYEYILFINPPEPYLFDEVKKYSRKKCICTTWEPPTVRPDYYANDLSGFFLYNLVMFDDLVDNRYFLKLFYPQPSLTMQCSDKKFDQKKLCCLIAKNWRSNYKYELYSKRREIIEFFNIYHNENFDLFGRGWPGWLTVYRGELSNKRTALHNYRFCICYENTCDLNGYITEKIFDCFVSGCIPVYWGAGNITKYIPKTCFIDRRDFPNNEELYMFLKRMKKNEYEEYIQNIKNYLQSEQAFLFSIEYFVDTIVSLINPGYNNKYVFNDQQIRMLEKAKQIKDSK